MILSIITAVFILSLIGIYYFSRYLQLKEYRERFDDIFIINRNPDTGEELNLQHLSKYVVQSDYRKVVQTADNQKRLLIKAKNPFFNNNLKEKQQLRVIPIIYQSGEYIVEDWNEYKERVIFTIKESLSSRHEYLKKSDEIWYLKYGDQQKNISWTNTKQKGDKKAIG